MDAVLAGLRGMSFGGWLVVEQDILPRSAERFARAAAEQRLNRAFLAARGAADMGALFRLGLIGAGRMGRTHLRGLAGGERVAVTAIAEASEATRRTVPDVGRRCTRTSRRCSTPKPWMGS